MKHLLDLFKHTRPRDLLWFSGYALYLVFGYMVFHSTTVLSSVGNIDFNVGVMFLCATLIARAVVFLVVAVIFRSFSRISLMVLVSLTGGVAVTGFLVTAMVFQFSSEIPFMMLFPWLIFGGVLLGLSDALIILLWARFSSTLDLRSLYLYVVLCNAISLVVYFIVTLLPGILALPIAAVLFLTATLFAKKALDARSPMVWEYSRPVLKEALRRVSHPILGTSILCFMAGLMLQISGQQEIPLASFQQTSLITSAVAVLFLFLPALLVKKPLNVGRMYSIALPLSAAGFLLLPIIWNAAGGIVNSFAQLGSMVAGILLWCMLAETSRDTKLPPFLLFALAMAITNLALFLGTVIGFMNAETLQKGDIVLTTVALVAVYLLFMVALFLFKDKSLKNEEPTEEDSAIHSDQYLFDRCNEIAELHQFTPRETEIFQLLACGYTIPAISEKLFVSENTVKSHVKSIYQKLDVHVRSELIDLVNAKPSALNQ